MAFVFCSYRLAVAASYYFLLAAFRAHELYSRIISQPSLAGAAYYLFFHSLEEKVVYL